MWVSEFKNHKHIKDELLSLIDKVPKTPVKEDEHHTISHTDFYLPNSIPREYLTFFYNNISEHMVSLCNQFNSCFWNIKSAWFQQYIKGDTHGWHNHGESQLAGVYYLELPSRTMTTEFLDGRKIKAKEGDILIFPSFLYHRSKKINSSKRKTVIAFNLSFDGWNGKKKLLKF